MAQGNLSTKTGGVSKRKRGYDNEEETIAEVSDKRNGVKLSAPARLSLNDGKGYL